MTDRTVAEMEHKMAMDAVCFMAQMLEPHADALNALVEAERSMHSHLHITDPTTYMKAINSDSLKAQVRLANAALSFLREARAVREEIGDGLDE